MSGKSSFMSYYLNQTASSSYTPTLGVDTGKKMIENKNGSVSNINIWDFSGKLDFLDIRNEFYKDANVVLLFMDLSNKNSIDSLDYWIK